MRILLNAARRSHKLQLALVHISCGQAREEAQTLHGTWTVIKMPKDI